MSQQPSDHYARGIHAPTQDEFQRSVQVHPVECTNPTTPYNPSNGGSSSVPSDPQYQQWHRATGEPAIHNAHHPNYHSPQHYVPSSTHPQRDMGDGHERPPWQEGPSQAAGAFYTQDSRSIHFLSSLPTGVHSPHDHRHSSAWELEQGRRNSKQVQDHRNSDHPLVVGGSSSLGSPAHEHHAPPMASRHSPRQSFGPYTNTALHTRNPSITSGIGDHIHSRSPSHTPYPIQEQCLGRQISHNEPPQYVVPSSRIQRADHTMHTPPAGCYNTARVSHSPEEISETKPKRRRANAAQLQLLNDTYARTMFPTTEERADIARRINMTPRQVQIWFQNRRQASRQSQTGSTMEGIYGENHSDYLHEPENE